MHITISGAKSLYAGDSYYYYFILSYDNGTYFNNSNTQSAYSNMTISVYNGGTLISHYTPNIQSNGVILYQFLIGYISNNIPVGDNSGWSRVSIPYRIYF